MKINQRLSKHLRRSLGSEFKGNIKFTFGIRKELSDFFKWNFSRVQLHESEDLISCQLDDTETIESVFQLPNGKKTTMKAFSIAFGRDFIVSHLQPPLFITFQRSTCRIKVQGEFVTVREDKEQRQKRLNPSQVTLYCIHLIFQYQCSETADKQLLRSILRKRVALSTPSSPIASMEVQEPNQIFIKKMRVN